MADEQVYRERVQAGIRALDEEVPGWRNVLDADNLDMAEGFHEVRGRCGCIASQVHAWKAGEVEGEFTYGVGMLADIWPIGVAGTIERVERWAGEHGMYAIGDELPIDEEYALLTRLWREEIREVRYG